MQISTQRQATTSQPFSNGLSVVALVDWGHESSSAESCDVRRFSEVEGICGREKQLFAPEGSRVVGVPCGAGALPAASALDRGSEVDPNIPMPPHADGQSAPRTETEQARLEE
jgi:hypothetical protein